MPRLAVHSVRPVRLLISIGLMLAASHAALAGGTGTQVTAGQVPQPVIESARGDKCVEDPAFMRRNHMELLKHQRDDTLRRGIRTGSYSLKACIGCHASKANGSVTEASTNFCQSCHSYAAVKIDCFECHAGKLPQTSLEALASHGEPGQPLSLQSRRVLAQQQ